MPGDVRELALFAGAGGGLLGTHHLLGWRTVCAVELDPYRVDVLGARQRDGFLGPCPFPTHRDIRDFDGTAWRGRVDVVTAGFPCPPFSVAGKGLGEADPRNMWPDTARVIREVGPRFALLENVPGLLAHGYFGSILGDLAACGFNAEWDCFPASALGAPHRRDRLWILAYTPEARLTPGKRREGPAKGPEAARLRGGLSGADRDGLRDVPGWRIGSSRRSETEPPDDGAAGQVADADRERCNRRSSLRPGRQGWDPSGDESVERGRRWPTEPRLGRIAPDGMANRVDRVAAIGDGQVPGVVAMAWTALANRVGLKDAESKAPEDWGPLFAEV